MYPAPPVTRMVAFEDGEIDFKDRGIALDNSFCNILNPPTVIINGTMLVIKSIEIRLKQR